MSDASSFAVILSPPLTDFTRPVPELAQLKAAASLAGIDVHTVDLNLRAFLDLMSPSELREQVARCEARISGLVKRPALQFWEQQELLALTQGLSDGVKAAEDAGSALDALRDGGTFFHRDAYTHAVKTVSAAFSLVSGLVFPFELSLSSISAPFSCFSAQALSRFSPVDPFKRVYSKLAADVQHRGSKAVCVVLSEPSQFLPTFSLALELRKSCPDALLVLSGPWVEQWGEHEEARALALAHFDAVVTMDSEQLLPELLASHKDGKLKALPHVAYASHVNASGRAKAHAPIDVEKLPTPDASDLTLADYPVPEPVLSYRPSRGRHLQPTRLQYWALEGRAAEPRRVLSPELAAQQLLELAEKNAARFVQITADTVEPAWVSGLARALGGRRLRFSVELSLDRAVSADEAVAWRAAGCVSAVIGLMEHRARLHDVAHSFEALAHAGIAVQAVAVLSWPRATEDSAREVVNLLRAHQGEIDTFFVPETMADRGLRLSVAPFEGAYALNGDSVPSFPEFARLTAMQRDRVIADAERVGQGYSLRKGPFAGSVGSAHSLLGFDKYGRRVFAQPAKPAGLAARSLSEGDRIRLSPTAKMLWIPYQLSVLEEIAREEAEMRETELLKRARDVSADKVWAYSSRDDLKLRAGPRTPHVLAPNMAVTEITVGLADLLTLAVEQFLPVSQLVAKAMREMREALKRQLGSLHGHGALVTERESRSADPRPRAPSGASPQARPEGGGRRRRRRRGGRGASAQGAPPSA